MLPAEDDQAIAADAYIDALLAGHARRPLSLPAPPVRDAGVAATIDRLERLPRFHPSFLFEEAVAERLRSAARGDVHGTVTRLPRSRAVGENIALRRLTARRLVDRRLADRRLWLGGALASGMSLAGAAVIAWRRGRRTPGRVS